MEEKHKVVVANLARKELVGKTSWKGQTSKGSKIVIVYHSDGHLGVEIDGVFVSGVGLNPKEQPKGRMTTDELLKELPNHECQQFEWVI